MNRFEGEGTARIQESVPVPLDRYRRVRNQTEFLCGPLVAEDYVIQSMPDVSPTKWHLAHTSWFFETFILNPYIQGYQPYDPNYSYLFNSYYAAVGDRHCRAYRGLLSRPTVREVFEYRAFIDEQMAQWLAHHEQRLSEDPALRALFELGLNHEQQHQELMVTDIKHVFWVNPLKPAYRARTWLRAAQRVPPLEWIPFEGGITTIGHGGESFAFDNEGPQHQVLLQPFSLGSRLVTNGEYCQFIDDGGYRRPELWLSLGWDTVKREEWDAPLYWLKKDGRWYNHTLSGLRPVEESEPVCHVSFLEADAYARWAGVRLATEFEWEHAAQTIPVDGNFVESGTFHPTPCDAEQPRPAQMFGDIWEWTGSAYLGYPNFRPAAGAIGEYNGKFMCNQFVLRGGSCATPRSHIRKTYRNFFFPENRWQFSGIRLAKSEGSGSDKREKSVPTKAGRGMDATVESKGSSQDDDFALKRTVTRQA